MSENHRGAEARTAAKLERKSRESSLRLDSARLGDQVQLVDLALSLRKLRQDRRLERLRTSVLVLALDEDVLLRFWTLAFLHDKLTNTCKVVSRVILFWSDGRLSRRAKRAERRTSADDSSSQVSVGCLSLHCSPHQCISCLCNDKDAMEKKKSPVISI